MSLNFLQKATLVVAVVAGVAAVAVCPYHAPKAVEETWQAFVAAWPWSERAFFVTWTVNEPLRCNLIRFVTLHRHLAAGLHPRAYFLAIERRSSLDVQV